MATETPTATFMDRALRGEFTDLEEALLDHVGAWHKGGGFGIELHEYLGVSWEEYGRLMDAEAEGRLAEFIATRRSA